MEYKQWWRHPMETFSALLVLCEGNPPVTDEFPITTASQAELWCFLWSTPEQTVMFSLIFAWTNGWANNRYTSDLKHHRAHYDVTVMTSFVWSSLNQIMACRLLDAKPLAEQMLTCQLDASGSTNSNLKDTNILLKNAIEIAVSKTGC